MLLPRSQWLELICIMVLMVGYNFGCGTGGSDNVPQLAVIASNTNSPIQTPTAIASVTPSPTNSPTTSPSPTFTPSPTVEPTPSPSPTITATPSPMPFESPVILHITTDYPEAYRLFCISIVDTNESEEYKPYLKILDDFRFTLHLEREHRYEIGFNSPVSYFPITPRILEITSETPIEITESFSFIIHY